MKQVKLLFRVVFAALAVQAVADEATVSNVVVRQRWPWSPVVDIDYVLFGTNCDVTLTARCDGVEPFELSPAHMSGDLFDVAPGEAHVTWDPVAAGLGASTLPNFSVTVTPVADMSSRNYIILNLIDGSYTYAASEPAEGWRSADSENTGRKMVFRRIPAGTFYMGYPKGMHEWLLEKSGNERSYNKKHHVQHRVTLSSDYYIAAFLTSQRQLCCITGALAGASAPSMTSPGQYASASYNALRGADSTWPNGDKYAVAGDSFVAGARKIVAGSFPRDWIIDLPTSAQWERACRATMPTNWFFYNGGTVEDTASSLTNIVDAIARCKISPHGSGNNIGSKEPNQWGLYDMLGLQTEVTLDREWDEPSGECYGPMTDPVGSTSNSKRELRGGNTDTKLFYAVTPVHVAPYAPTTGWCSFRLCIHIKPIK